jgi:hypothetical protein
VPRSLPINLIAVAAVGVLVAMIGLVTFFSSELVGDTVAEQFRSQELQLVSSLAQQTETYFTSLNTEIDSLALQPAVNSLPVTNRDEALALLAEHGLARAGVVSSVVIFTHRGEPRYAWPESWQAAIDSGERLPYSLPSSLVNQTRTANYVPLERGYRGLSPRFPDKGTFLRSHRSITTCARPISGLELNSTSCSIRSWVLWNSTRAVALGDHASTRLFRANDTIPLQSLLDKVSLATLFIARRRLSNITSG